MKKRSGSRSIRTIRGAHPRPKPSSPRAPNPQPWFLALATPAIKLARERELRETLKLVRKLFSGFEARDGFDGRYPRNWTQQRRKRLQKFGYIAKTLTGTPSLIIKPRTERQRSALIKHTGQLYPQQIRFVVHVPKPQRARIRFVRDRARVPFMGAAALRLKTLRVEVVDRVAGGELYTRDYLFREILGYQPIDWRDFQDAMRRLLPYLPDYAPGGQEAMYTLLSEPHGAISSPVFKRFLLSEMEDWGEKYDDTFAGVLVGVRYQGDFFEAFNAPRSEYNERQRIRGVFQDIKAEYQRAIRRRNDYEFRERVRAVRAARLQQRRLKPKVKKKRAASRARSKRAKAKHK